MHASHSFLYLIVRSGTGLAGIISIVVFTRLMEADEYGIYATLLSGLGVCYAIFFQWLSQGLGRFYGCDSERQTALVSTVGFGFVVAVVVSSMFWGIAMLLSGEHLWMQWLWYLPPLVFSYAWYELNLRIANAEMLPKLYGYISASKAGLGLSLGVIFYLYFGLHGVFLGLIMSAILPPICWMRSRWRIQSLQAVDKQMFRTILAYGLPLALTVTLTLVVDVSDRFIITALLNAEQAGLYAASYDLVVQTMGFFVAAFYLSTFPRLVKEMGNQPVKSIASSMARYGMLLFATSVPLLIVFTALAGNVSAMVLGAPFRESAIQLIPIIALGVFIGSLKIHFLDVTFQLAQRTTQQIWPALLTAVVNVALNVAWIPEYGIVGAAYATLAAFLFGCIASAVMVKKIIPLVLPVTDFFKICFAGISMYLLLYFLEFLNGLFALLFQLLCGFFLYVALVIVLNVAGLRHTFLNIVFNKNA